MSTTSAPFANSGGVLELLTNGAGGKYGGLRLQGSAIPSGRNLLEIELDDHSGTKLLELRTNATITSCNIIWRGLITFPSATELQTASILVGAYRQIAFDTVNQIVIGCINGQGNGLTIGNNAATDKIGFFGATPVTRQNGVAVTAAAIHAALVNLGLITA